MDSENNIEKPRFNWKRLVITTGIALIVAGVIGGTVWYLMNQQAKRVADSNAKQVADLEKQIEDLKKAKTTTTTDSPSAASVTVVGPDKIIQYFEEAKIKHDYNEAVKFVTKNVINAYSTLMQGSNQTSGDVFYGQIAGSNNHTLAYSIVDSGYTNQTTFTATVRERVSDTPCSGTEQGPCIDHMDIKTTVIKQGTGWVIDTYMFPYGIGKPVIYLYPKTKSNISVKVNPDGGMSESYPKYNNGWAVVADPSGEITLNGATYPYLFWEGNSYDVNVPAEGTVVKRENIPAYLDSKLALLGLNIKEAADFKEFWLPRMQSKPYYFVNFIPKEEEDRIAPISVTPTPDSIIRVLMYFRGTDSWYPTIDQTLKPAARNGFSVIEWGGIFE